MIEGVALVGGVRVSLERGNPVRTGAQRCGVLCVAGGSGLTDAILKLRFADDWRARADEGGVGVWFWSVEGDSYGAVIQGAYVGYAGKRAGYRATRRLVGAVAPSENHVCGGHQATVRPLDAISQSPCDGCEVVGNTAVLHRRYFPSQGGDEVAQGVVLGQGFEGYGPCIPLLDSRRKVGTGQCRGLPVLDSQNLYCPLALARGARRTGRSCWAFGTLCTRITAGTLLSALTGFSAWALWACGSRLSRLALLSQFAGVPGVALGALATCDPGVTLISLDPLGTNGPRFA